MSRPFKSERHLALAAEFADTKPATFAACSGPCNGGRKLCPAPEACQIQLPEIGTRWTPLLLWLLGVPAVVCAIACVAVFLPAVR